MAVWAMYGYGTCGAVRSVSEGDMGMSGVLVWLRGYRGCIGRYCDEVLRVKLGIFWKYYLCLASLSMPLITTFTVTETKKSDIMANENVRKYRLTHEELASMFGYKSVHAFRSSSAHKRLMEGCDRLVAEVVRRIKARL